MEGFLQNVVESIKGAFHLDGKGQKQPRVAQRSSGVGVPAATSPEKLKATVVLMKKNVLDFTDFNDSVLDRAHELLGEKVSFQLVSSSVTDPSPGDRRGKVGSPAYLEAWITTLTSLSAGESRFSVAFEWRPNDGVPGAVIVKNNHHSEFFLKSLAIDDLPGHGRLFFDCNSWVYPVEKYSYDRVFFTNKPYLPGNTPEPLRHLREEELLHLRGDDVTGELQEHDRIYGYAFYNDLGEPDKGESYARPVLGGSQEHPYPRRGRTSRPPTKSDPNTESRLPLLSLNIYVPRDERFGHLKMSDFLAYALKVVVQSLAPALKTLVEENHFDFRSFQDVLNLYGNGVLLPEVEEIEDRIPFEMIKDFVNLQGERVFKLPVPQVIAGDVEAWRSDEEFARETLAGVNPVIISLLTEFPPRSKLDPEKYGDQNSTITAAHIEPNLEGLTVNEALRSRRLFIVDHHDTVIPYLTLINATSSKVYASRTIFFLKSDGSLKPLAIELSLPTSDGDAAHPSPVSTVFTPSDDGVRGSVWKLAKAYATVGDSGVHQLISHWLNTHAVIEPFVIATNRQLSAVHPVNQLLKPHYRDTMNINALARQILINAGGVLESTVFPGRYAMEMSSVVYKNWKLTEQGLPQDLLKRGVAVEDPSQPSGVRLLIKDYPYAVDGLAIWVAIRTWVSDYISIYYPNDGFIKADTELQSWWSEIRQVGHGDKKDESWWPAMNSVSNLAGVCTTVIWVASALHAAVNFGQYPYAGYLPNRPTISRRFMPEPGTEEYSELERNPDGVFLKTITSQLQTLLGISLIEILSRHSSDEVYLGQRDTAEWTSDEKAIKAFEKFGETLVEIENRILAMNGDGSLKNRIGPVKVPYTLLYPDTSDFSGVGGLTGRGVPNSVSI